MLVACDPSTVQWVVCVAIFMVEDVWRLYPYFRGEMHTHICGSGSGDAAVMSAVPILVSIASRSAQMHPRNGDLYVYAVCVELVSGC